MEVFVVRIYRNDSKGDKANPHSFVGIVEEVATERKKAFRDYDELWKILIPTKEKKGDR